jgi:ribonuclease P protein component
MLGEGPSAPAGDDHARAAKKEAFPRRLRLRRRREFLRVQRSGAKHHTRFFLVFVAPTPSEAAPVEAGGLPGTRLGVTVTRKVGKAVKRNRIKRLVREVFRRERGALPAGLDMVWVAKRDAVGTTFEDVVHDMRTLAGRLRSR